MNITIRILAVLVAGLGLLLGTSGHADSDERNKMLVAVALIFDGQDRVMNPPLVVSNLSAIQATTKALSSEAAFYEEQAAHYEAQQRTAELAAQLDRVAAFEEAAAEANRIEARAAEAEAEAVRWLAKQAESEVAEAVAEQGSIKHIAAQMAVAHYADLAQRAAEKATQYAEQAATVRASEPTEQRLNSSVAASNLRYAKEQVVYWRKRAAEKAAESKQYADRIAQVRLTRKQIYDGPQNVVNEACEKSASTLRKRSGEIAREYGLAMEEFVASVQCVEVTPWFEKQWGKNWRKMDITLLFNTPISIRIAAWVLPQPEGLRALAVGLYDDQRTCNADNSWDELYTVESVWNKASDYDERGVLYDVECIEYTAGSYTYIKDEVAD